MLPHGCHRLRRRDDQGRLVRVQKMLLSMIKSIPLTQVDLCDRRIDRVVLCAAGDQDSEHERDHQRTEHRP